MSFLRNGCEILTPLQMSRVNELCGIAEEILIDNAGHAVASEVARRYGARKTIVMCGLGENGHRGRVAARYLKTWGWPVEVADEIGDAELIVDAVDFSVIRADAINLAGVPEVAIDLSSGLDGLSGKPSKGCVNANLTLTFFRKKPAHVLFPGKQLCGEVVVLDIGISNDVLETIDVKTWENSKPIMPAFLISGHKFNRGHAVIISGGKLNTGASRLTAQAALKTGAGLVTLVGDADALAVQANHVTAIMLAEISTTKALAEFMLDPRRNVICVGPAAGIGETTRQNVKVALASAAVVVLDADALMSYSENSDELFSAIKSRTDSSVVMTPHEGELARLFGGLIADSDSKIERAKMAAQISGAIIILKGADTVIAHPDGRAVVNTNAPPSLATAGSGDVLAGIVTGLLAQAMPVFEAACAAVWLHGETANSFGRRAFTAEDLVQQIGQNP